MVEEQYPMEQGAEANSVVLVYEPSCENDLAFVESILRSTNIPFWITGERGVQYGRVQLYVAPHDAEEVRELIAEIFSYPGKRETPAPAPSVFDPLSFAIHVMRVTFCVILLFLAIVLFVFLLSRPVYVPPAHSFQYAQWVCGGRMV